MRCDNCKGKFVPIYFLQRHCSEPDCRVAEKKYQEEIRLGTTVKTPKAIPKFSDKRKVENLKYLAQRIVFLGKKENKICPITKWPATEIHHTYCGKDRAQYYLDESTWIAVSRDGHNWIHDNPKEAREQGFLK
jgi:hypothetical protein